MFHYILRPWYSALFSSDFIENYWYSYRKLVGFPSRFSA